jgi:hypothetical protein
MAQKEIELILLRQWASHMTLPIWVTGLNGDLIYYNEPAEALLGVRYDEAGEMPLDATDGDVPGCLGGRLAASAGRVATGDSASRGQTGSQAHQIPRYGWSVARCRTDGLSLRGRRTPPAGRGGDLVGSARRVKITLCGTRGSLANAGPDTLRYGGNTACVEVRGNDGAVLILDAGTGIRSVGDRLAGNVSRVDLLLTHLHMDHIQGLGFFKPLYTPDLDVHLGPAVDDDGHAAPPDTLSIPPALSSADTRPPLSVDAARHHARAISHRGLRDHGRHGLSSWPDRRVSADGGRRVVHIHA